LRKNELRVRNKNAIMQTWNEIKNKNRPPSLQDMIEKLLEKQR
jgi:hypothetical protein